MRIILDLDGVLVDFLQAMLDRHGAKNPYLDPANLGNYDLPEALGMKPDAFWYPFDDADFWANLPWTKEGKELVEMATQFVGEKKIYLVTRPCPKFTVNGVTLSWHCVAGKMRWIEKHLPRFICRCFYGVPKQLMAAHHRVLVDDCDANIELFREKGGGTVLVPRPWNSGHARESRLLEDVAGDIMACGYEIQGVPE